MKIRVLLPAYNEELSLPPLLKRLDNFKQASGLHLDVLVVNDGSVDGTLDVAKNYTGGIRVLVYDQQPNQGLAAAMRNGLRESIAGLEDNDIVVSMDADDSHDPEAMLAMVSKISAGADLVIASRYQPGAEIHGLSPFRKFLSLAAGQMFGIFARVKGAKDYTCGYRAFRVSLVRKAIEHFGDRLIEQQGFACTPEILLKMNVLRPRVEEVPFILRYDLKQGESKMNVGKTTRQALLLIWKSRNFK